MFSIRPFILETNMEKTIISFKERVKNCAIENSVDFKKNFIDKEYCICSDVFPEKYFIIKALEENYLHLVGVSTSLPANAFFKKCINKTLTENDFDFTKRGVRKNELKGAVREKIRVLPSMVGIFNNKKALIQYGFNKNKINCVFASSDNQCTLGYAASGHPKSLLRGQYLDNSKSKKIDILLSKEKGKELFDKIEWSNTSYAEDYLPIIDNIITEEIRQKLINKEL